MFLLHATKTGRLITTSDLSTAAWLLNIEVAECRVAGFFTEQSDQGKSVPTALVLTATGCAGNFSDLSPADMVDCLLGVLFVLPVVHVD